MIKARHRPIHLASEARNSFILLLSSKESGRLDRHDNGHSLEKREIGQFGNQGLSKVVDQTHQYASHCRPFQAPSSAHDDNNETQRQKLKIETGINPEDGTTHDSTEGSQKSSQAIHTP